MDKKCKNCKYYTEYAPNGKGECRRYPPIIKTDDDSYNSISEYSIVLGSSCGCGEFKKNNQ